MLFSPYTAFVVYTTDCAKAGVVWVVCERSATSITCDPVFDLCWIFGFRSPLVLGLGEADTERSQPTCPNDVRSSGGCLACKRGEIGTIGKSL